jgi:galactose mutarotase-like enzyme
MALIAAGTHHSLTRGLADGHPVLVLGSKAGVEVTVAPGLGMVVCSMRHRGDELLGRRGGLAAYAARGETMGVPLLYPWANRLAAHGYRFGGRDVALQGLSPRDDDGLPIHGLLAAVHGWRLIGAGADGDGARAIAELDAPGLEGFPFPHVARVRMALRGARLTIETIVQATDAEAVPVCFGYHPYLRLPGMPREEWEIELPVARHLRVDARGIPMGASVPVVPVGGSLGRRRFDDGYVVADGGQPFAVTGGGRRIEVAFEAGYPFAQVFAPCDDDVICFEPMTAPTNSLRAGPPSVAPGETYRAQFSITVSPW